MVGNSLGALAARAETTREILCGKLSQEDEKLEIPIGNNIRRLRIERKMTQRELAWRLKVSVQAVSKWERGYSYPDVSLLLPIARIFSVSLDELFGSDGAEQTKKHSHSNA